MIATKHECERLTPQQIERMLQEFTGTEGYTRHWTGLLLTDGVVWLAENAHAWWLLDLIASYQPQCQRDEMLRDVQFWTLKVDLDKHAAEAICERDAGDVAVRQQIPFTDFPLPSVRVWVQQGVALLPSEY